MRKYDIGRLVDDADSVMVAKNIGNRVIRKGRYHFVFCPEHKKELGKVDSQLGNCILTANGYKCFACGAKGNIVEYVMQELNLELYEACDIVADITGCREDYLLTDDEVESSKKKYPLSFEELEILGLKTLVHIIRLYNCTEDKSEVLHLSKTVDDGYYYLVYAEEIYRLNELYKENKELFFCMVEGKALEGIEKRKKVIEGFCQPRCNFGFILEFGFKTDTLEMQWNIENVLQGEIRILQNILKRIGSKQIAGQINEVPDLYRI